MKKLIIIASAVLALAGPAEARSRGFVNPDPSPSPSDSFPASWEGCYEPGEPALDNTVSVLIKTHSSKRCNADVLTHITASGYEYGGGDITCKLKEGRWNKADGSYVGYYDCIGMNNEHYATTARFTSVKKGELRAKWGSTIDGPRVDNGPVLRFTVN